MKESQDLASVVSDLSALGSYKPCGPREVIITNVRLDSPLCRKQNNPDLGHLAGCRGDQ